MARPRKKGINYFPLDLDHRADDKLARLIAKHGAKGIGIWVELLTNIYRVGCCYKWGAEEAEILGFQTREDVREVTQIVDTCVRVGLFDKDVLKASSMLTSKAIQRQYLEIARRRAEVTIPRAVLLLPEAELPKCVVLSSCISLKRKRKETGKKPDKNPTKTIQKPDKNPPGYRPETIEVFDRVWLTKQELTKLNDSFGTLNVKTKMIFLSEKLESLVNTYTKRSNHYKCLLNWLTSDLAAGKITRPRASRPDLTTFKPPVEEPCSMSKEERSALLEKSLGIKI